MAHSKITLIGMYQYMDAEGDDLFSEIVLPAGTDKQTLIDSLMLRGAEFEVLYPDPDVFRYAIGAWSKKWQRTLEKWAKALSIDYNPLENYDRNESWSDAKKANGTQKGNSSDAAVSNGNTSDEDTRAAYDSSTYSPLNKSVGTSGNSSSSASVMSAESANTESSEHIGRTHGNIGVTTSQQMLEAEWKVAELSFYESASDLFLTELCIYTY